MATYAFRPNPDKKWADAIFNSLMNGVARFGWSFIPTADLNSLKAKIEKDGWNSLSDKEQQCWQPFLLGISAGDYLVYINIPEYGKCTLAKVISPYFFKYHSDLVYEWGNDGNHCIGVDPDSIKTFYRNGQNVHPALSRRLKLQSRYWRITAEKEFHDLLNNIDHNNEIDSGWRNLEFLKKDLLPAWHQIGELIHKTHPGKDLEKLIAEVFRRIPNTNVIENGYGWGTDHGADILVEVTEGLHDFPQLLDVKRLVVQVKSYKNDHYNLDAVHDIKRAIVKYDAHMGLIVTTARTTDYLEEQVEKLSRELDKKINVCDITGVAKLVAKYLLNEIS